jgi:hypothetical protein
LILSRILWLQGLPEQGLRLAERNVEDARAIDLAGGGVLCAGDRIPGLHLER